MEAVNETHWYDWAIPYVTEISLINYLVPLVVCAIVYLFRTIGDYKHDIQNCHNQYYNPQLTVGIIFWRLFVTVCPGINVFAMVFDCASSVFKYIGKTFDFPLVGHRYRPTPDAVKEDVRNQHANWVETQRKNP